MGAIMAVGVSVANAILLVTFAERHRQSGQTSVDAGIVAAKTRIRAILMTSIAMVAGMVPMALGIGGGDEAAPLARSVIGGLLASLIATILVLPGIFAVVMGRSATVGIAFSERPG